MIHTNPNTSSGRNTAANRAILTQSIIDKRNRKAKTLSSSRANRTRNTSSGRNAAANRAILTQKAKILSSSRANRTHNTTASARHVAASRANILQSIKDTAFKRGFEAGRSTSISADLTGNSTVDVLMDGYKFGFVTADANGGFTASMLDGSKVTADTVDDVFAQLSGKYPGITRGATVTTENRHHVKSGFETDPVSYDVITDAGTIGQATPNDDGTFSFTYNGVTYKGSTISEIVSQLQANDVPVQNSEPDFADKTGATVSTASRLKAPGRHRVNHVSSDGYNLTSTSSSSKWTRWSRFVSEAGSNTNVGHVRNSPDGGFVGILDMNSGAEFKGDTAQAVVDKMSADYGSALSIVDWIDLNEQPVVSSRMGERNALL